MSDDKYLRPGNIDFAAAHVVEECGELTAALGKTQRWGWLSVNPELPEAQQELNVDWVRREMADLRDALDRLDVEIKRKYEL